MTTYNRSNMKALTVPTSPIMILPGDDVSALKLEKFLKAATQDYGNQFVVMIPDEQAPVVEPPTNAE